MTATAAAVVPAPVLSVTVTRAEGFEDELKTVAFVGPGALAEARAEPYNLAEKPRAATC